MKKVRQTPSGSLGPSTATPPYVVSTKPGVGIVSIMSGVESVNVKTDLPAFVAPSIPTQRRTVGKLDGLGLLFDSRTPDHAVLLSNHEMIGGKTLNHTQRVITRLEGIPRRHHTTEAGNGSLVTRWQLGLPSLEVISQSDQIAQIQVWDRELQEYRPAEAAKVTSVKYRDGENEKIEHQFSEQDLNNLCSGDLPPSSALWDSSQQLGTLSRIFFSGEEIFFGGRAFAHIVTGPQTGTSWELPALGRLAFENIVCCPQSQTLTVAVAPSDAGSDFPEGNLIAVWVGQKTSRVNLSTPEPWNAGFDPSRGTLYGVKVESLVEEGNQESQDFQAGQLPFGLQRRLEAVKFSLVPISNQARGPQPPIFPSRTMSELRSAGATVFAKCEDAAWNPSQPSQCYFLSSGLGAEKGISRLWRLEFSEINHPERGGLIRLMLDGFSQGLVALDNLAVNSHGQLILCEDPGAVQVKGKIYLPKVWAYDPRRDWLESVAQFDSRVIDGSWFPGIQSAETSGVIDASAALGEGWFLLDVQIDQFFQQDPQFLKTYGATSAQELVAPTQLLALFVPQFAASPHHRSNCHDCQF